MTFNLTNNILGFDLPLVALGHFIRRFTTTAVEMKHISGISPYVLIANSLTFGFVSTNNPISVVKIVSIM